MFLKNPLQDLLSSLNAVISTNECTEFRPGHVIYNPAYTYKFQLKTTEGILENKKKFIKMMAVIVGAFGICWLPWHFFHVVGMIYPTVMRYVCHYK